MKIDTKSIPFPILLLTPPLTQINTPYPATAYLTGFLRKHGHIVSQTDPGLDLFLSLFCKDGLKKIGVELRLLKKKSPSVSHFLENEKEYRATIEAVIRFLQGGDPTFAHRICTEGFLPQGPRFAVLSQRGGAQEGLDFAFGVLGVQDRAKYLASLYIDDLSDVIREGVDPHFELSRYAERLAVSASSFDPIREALHTEPTLVDRHLDAITRDLVSRHTPALVGISVPFPGNVYGAFRIAKQIKEISPHIKIVLGGGYINTELRDMQDPRVFDYVDYLTLDDGERPLLSIIEGLKAGRTPDFFRTLICEKGKVVLRTTSKSHDIPFRDSGTPTYDGLPNHKYLSLCELLNPMHRLWSDGRWNKLTLAHGCYWKQCTFCDTTLDYIGRYETAGADLLVDRIEQLIQETGQTGFHFVDEAAPPKVLEALAERLVDREVQITWWGNIRFEKTFTLNLTKKLAKSGCIAISGGLEVASDRLLTLMKKGATVEQVARVTRAFTDAGILVHAYLMYGFPTETEQETIDSLERVRQLFAAGCLQSAYWHRFSATVHSPVGKRPADFGIELQPVESTFARNDVPFRDFTGVKHEKYFPGLKKAVYNYMHGVGLEEDVRFWFDFSVPKTKVPKTLIEKALRAGASEFRRNSRGEEGYEINL